MNKENNSLQMEYIYMYNEYTLYNNAPIALKHVSCLHVPSL